MTLAMVITALMTVTTLVLAWGGMYMRNWFLLVPAWWLVVQAKRSELLNNQVAL
jgi:hypothetical protein